MVTDSHVLCVWALLSLEESHLFGLNINYIYIYIYIV